MRHISTATGSPIPTDPLARTAWVQAQLKCHGWSFRRLGEAHGITGNGLSQAMYKPSVRAEQILAEAIGLTPIDIWPERFDRKTGKRLHRTFPQRSAAKRQRNVYPQAGDHTDDAAA